VFVCQNNQFAISVPVQRQSGNARLFEKAWAYGMPGERVDGNDPELVLDAIATAAERARSGEGPSFLELLTYRMGPHSSSDDPSRYRDENETRAWAERDPVLLIRGRLERDGIWDAAREQALSEELTREIERAVELAESAGPPPVSSLFDDVYAKKPRHLQEQAEELAAAPRP
jgi:pyruvate dehydrogenase E1 component alpha subunit/2-oxoisovalerate dehydrogenase E1 component alpha subunit